MKIYKEINRKILIALGQTGSGKTTLLNSLIKTLCGIQLQDDYRYIIIDERAKTQGFKTKIVNQKVGHHLLLPIILKYLMIFHQSL